MMKLTEMAIYKKIRGWLSKIGTVDVVTCLTIVWIFACTAPICFDFSRANIVGKIFMIIASLFAGALLAFLIYENEATKASKSIWRERVHLGFWGGIYLIGILMYFDYELFEIKDLAFGVLFCALLLIDIYTCVKVLLAKTVNNERTPLVLIVVAVLTLLIAFVNESIGNTLPSDLYYKISIGITYLIAVSLYANKYLFKLQNTEKHISNIVGIIFWGALVLISFPFYVQWCGLKSDDFDTFVTVYSALIGGGITLAGVAWTIKDSENKRKEDERKKLMPYIMLVTPRRETSCTAEIRYGDDFDFAENADKMKDDTYYVTYFDDVYIKNVCESNIILKGLFLNDIYYPFLYPTLLESEGVCKIPFEGNWKATAQKITSIKLVLTDILENIYTVSSRFAYTMNHQPQKDSMARENGVVYTCYSYTYELKCFGLPERLKEGEASE